MSEYDGLIERLRKLSNVPGDERDRGKIGRYIEICKEAAAVITILESRLAEANRAACDAEDAERIAADAVASLQAKLESAEAREKSALDLAERHMNEKHDLRRLLAEAGEVAANAEELLKSFLGPKGAVATAVIDALSALKNKIGAT